MVKIVGDDSGVFKRITCSKCAAILEYTEHELKHYVGKDYSGGSDGRDWLDCPRCGNEVIVNAW